MKHQEIFRVKGLPVFTNKMFDDEVSARLCAKGDVALSQDLETGLIFNAAFDPTLLKYDADYQNEQAYSAVFQKHLDDVTEIIQKYFYGKTLIEVGCGKGYFLEHLRKAGYQIIGMDPAYEGANPNIIKACFNKKLGLSADCIILRHILEHVLNPVDFLSAISETNSGRGQIYIEVPCFDWICKNKAWFDISYEHVNYFRITDFHRIFGTVHECGHVFGGQYLYAVADLATLQKPTLVEDNLFQFAEDFMVNIKRLAKSTKGKRNAVWGGASKGAIFVFYMEQAGGNIDMVIDINPAKQGRFMAGSGLRVSAPEEALRLLREGDNIFIMNSNYFYEIVMLSENKFNYIRVDHNEF